MRGVTSLSLFLVLAVAGTAAGADAPGGGGRIVFVSERAPDLGHTRFVAVTPRGAVTELAIADPESALSPDGARVASARPESPTRWGIYVASAAGGDERRLASSAFAIFDLAWSPDGAALAYTVADSSVCSPGDHLCAVFRLFVVPSVGGEPRKLADAARSPRWSPNGRWVAFAGEWNTFDASFNGVTGKPYVVRSGGGSSRRLAQVHGLRSFAWSPRSDALVVATTQDVAIVAPLGGRPRRVGRARAVAWSRRDVLALGLEGTLRLVRTTGRTLRVVRNLDVRIEALAWSPRGDSVAYSGAEARTPPPWHAGLVSVSTGRGRVVLSTDPLASIRLVGWTTDGARVLLATLRATGNDYDLFSIAPDGSGLRRLTDDATFDFDPSWSPRAERVAYVTVTPGGLGQSRVFVLDADGRGKTAITSPPPGTADLAPAWAPDGSRIVFIRSHAPEGSPESDLFTVAPDGSGLAQLTRVGGELRGPTWSPDGTQIAFARLAQGRGAITVVNADGSGYRELVSTFGSPLVSWSPDGSRLAFVRPSGGLAVYTIGSGLASVVADADVGFSAPSWSPDGSRLVYEDDGDLYTVASAGGVRVPLVLAPGRDGDPDWSR